jgi:hypothetical protein
LKRNKYSLREKYQRKKGRNKKDENRNKNEIEI